MEAPTLDHEFYDLQSRRRAGGGVYLCDARLLLGDGSSVVFEDGWAGRVPVVQVKQILAIRNDMFAMPSNDQSPLALVGPEADPALADEEFEPAPLGAIVGATTSAPTIVDGHRVPPPRPELSPEELERRRVEGQAYLDSLPVQERPGTPAPSAEMPVDAGRTVLASDGLPIDVPFGVELGSTPGWPVNELGQPLRLTYEQRHAHAEDLIAKAGGLLAADVLADGVAGSVNATPPAPTPPTGEISTGEISGSAEPTAEVLLAPVPTGFETQTGTGESRCLASKADSTQCQNAARPPQHPQACHLGPHQVQVAEAAAATSRRLAAV